MRKIGFSTGAHMVCARYGRVLLVSNLPAVGAGRTESIGAADSLTVGGSRSETVSANEAITIHGNRTETVDKNDNVYVFNAATIR